ncbi:type II secretion system protein [Rariglobus hedericola]|uniref:Type II secretion system protein n=1 Tax=Rariglobus hedericola TaxID=2597822 RepID=A0A556QJV8_9BACT|nr:type II secretion system protein [Rariglobus hedericola]TSJ76934.1 type II secretion system protein [Rariglobus hedericola]
MKRHNYPTTPSARAGFTLIELLTVIAIIGILASILIPVVGKVKESAAKSTCASNLHQLAVGTLTYANDNRGSIPLRPAGSVIYPFPHAFISADWDAFSPYLGNPPKDGIMFCPGPLKAWRSTETPGYAATGTTANYVTYSYFGNLPLKAAIVAGFGAGTPNVLKQRSNVPDNFPLWTCLTYRSAGRSYGHSDPEPVTGSVQGQNAAHADGSVRWVKGPALVSYFESAGVDFYAPAPVL